MFRALQQKLRCRLFRPQISSGALTLSQRRIFILPTRRGLGFAGVLLLMLLGDINYNLSLGYVLTFLLGTTASITMLHAFRNLAQLEIRAGHCAPAFAGNDAYFVFHFHNHSRLPRCQLTLRDDGGHCTVFDLPAQRSSRVQHAIPAVQRGWLDSGRLTLCTEYPLGLFHAWSYLHFDARCLVYPRPAAPQAMPASSAQNGSGKVMLAGDGDFSGLRNYVPGDALQHIAWKVYAREQGLQVKQFSAPQGQELWLDWSLLPHIASERKLELFTRWVMDAETQGLLYGLRLPRKVIPPQRGRSHCAECLRALALFGLAET